jgi:hypothetical protein
MKTITCFILCSLLVFSSCKKKEDTDGAVNTPEETYALNIDSGWSMRARINGVDYSMSETNGATGSMSFLKMPDFPNTIYSFVSTLSDTVDLSIRFNGFVYPEGQVISDQDFLNFFAPRNYTYQSSNLNHISIEFIDHYGMDWTTDFFNQSGSEFQIVDAKLVPGLPHFNVKVYCRFRCFLFGNGGGSKILNNGEFVGLLQSGQ